MATLDECRTALNRLATRLSTENGGRRIDMDRTLACRVTDLNAAFHARLRAGHIENLADGDNPDAKIKLIIGSDDLIDLVSGRLDITRAVASGRIKIHASVFDLLKLQKLL